MLSQLTEYHWAVDMDEALFLLARPGIKTVPLAGGTHLLGQQDSSIEAVIDLRDLGLNTLSEDARGIHIGAMTTLQSLADAPLFGELALNILARAARTAPASRLLRNSATIGGTLALGSAAQTDIITALVALDAEAVVRSGSRTQVDLQGGTTERPGLSLLGVVYKGKQERRIACQEVHEARRPGELIIEVVVPRPGLHTGAAFTRISRTPSDVALLNAAATVEIVNGRYQRVRLVLGGVNMEPTRLLAVERQYEGTPVHYPIDSQKMLTDLQVGMASFRPPNDMRVSSSYRRVSGMSAAYRVLEEAINVAHWHSMVASGKG
jgi:CO/xanthine dehydrogenase FAD-binding subunit